MTDFTPPRRLTAEDDADGFDCGLPVVNDWLRNQLRNAGKQHTAVAYATFCDGAPAGFYTLGAYSIGHAEANGWLRRNSPDPIPAILLGMLGVAMRYQTMHVGGTAAQGRRHAGDGCGGDSRSQGVARGAGLGQGHALLRALRVPPHRTVGQDVHPSPFGVNGMPVEEGGGEGRGRFSPPPCFLSNRFRRPAVHFLGGRALPSESNWASCPMALPVLARAPVSSRIRSPVSAVRRASLSWSMAAFTWLR